MTNLLADYFKIPVKNIDFYNFEDNYYTIYLKTGGILKNSKVVSLDDLLAFIYEKK